MEQRDGTFQNRRSNRQEGGKDVESQGRRQEGPGRGAWTQLSQSAGSHGTMSVPSGRGQGGCSEPCVSPGGNCGCLLVPIAETLPFS